MLNVQNCTKIKKYVYWNFEQLNNSKIWKKVIQNQLEISREVVLRLNGLITMELPSRHTAPFQRRVSTGYEPFRGCNIFDCWYNYQYILSDTETSQSKGNASIIVESFRFNKERLILLILSKIWGMKKEVNSCFRMLTAVSEWMKIVPKFALMQMNNYSLRIMYIKRTIRNLFHKSKDLLFKSINAIPNFEFYYRAYSQLSN